jgi:hypothetical protein
MGSFEVLLQHLRAAVCSAVGTVTSHGLDDRWAQFMSWYGQRFSLLHIIQTSPGAQPASYPISTRESFLGGEAAAVCS